MILFLPSVIRAAMVEEYFGDGSRFGITGCGMRMRKSCSARRARSRMPGNYVTDEQFFVLNGDTFYQMDFG